MALSDTAYTRLVTALKIGLPLVALAILSTVFFLARSPDLERAIPFADVDVDALAREPRITEPNFSAVTPDGVAVSLRALTARPDPQDASRFLANGMRGAFETEDGTRIRMSSIGGVVDTGTGIATLSGDVLVESSLGYAIRTEELITHLDSTRSESTGAVDIMAPFGHMTAGGMMVTRETDDSTNYNLVFNGGVDLIYEPRD